MHGGSARVVIGFPALSIVLVWWCKICGWGSDSARHCSDCVTLAVLQHVRLPLTKPQGSNLSYVQLSSIQASVIQVLGSCLVLAVSIER